MTAIRALYQKILAEKGDRSIARDAVSRLKVELPGILWSGLFTTRAADVALVEKLTAHSGLLCADLDNLTPDQITEIRAKLEADPHVFAVFLSPTGTGLKVVFRVPADLDHHEASFRTVQEHVRKSYGVEIDGACRDVPRLCFASHDPRAFLNREAVELVPSISESNAPMMGIETATPGLPSYGTLPPSMQQLLADGAEAGERNPLAFKLACQLRDAGYDQEAAGKLIHEFAIRCRPPLPPTEVRSVTNSAYCRPPRKPTLRGSSVASKDASRPNGYIDEEIEPDESTEAKSTAPEKGGSVAERLVGLAVDLPLFRDDEGTPYAEVPRSGSSGTEVLRIRSGRFAEWLAAEYHRKYRGVARRCAIDDARAVIAGEAELRGAVQPVYIRVGGNDRQIQIDLGDAGRRVVKVGPDGWIVSTASDMKFLRPAKALPLPEPRAGGDFSALWRVLNVRERDRVLCAGWLLSSLQPKGPFFLANFVGEQGTGKSFACRVLRTVIDPSSVPLRRGTTEERSLWVAAANNRVLAFENLSGMPAWLSDALCALATGGGYSSRALFTDGDEAAINAQRPVLLNGIADVVARPDLAERTLRIELDPIPPDRRRTESDLNRELGAIVPGVLGALLDAAVFGLSRLDSFNPKKLPRMADAARWIEACLPRLGFEEGEFLSALDRHEQETADSNIEGSVVARAIVAMLDGVPYWTGPAGELLNQLRSSMTEADQRSRDWPNNPRSLAGTLRRLAPMMRRAGFQIVEPRPGDKVRKWRLHKLGVSGLSPEPPDPPDATLLLEMADDDSLSPSVQEPAASPVNESGSGHMGGVGGSGDSPETPSSEADVLHV